MQEKYINMLLQRTNEYKDKLANFQGKGLGSIQILKKEDKEHEEAIKNAVNTGPPSYPYIENIPYINYSEGSLAFMWDKNMESLNITKRMTTHGLALTSSRRNLRKRSII
jgi:hypothetical protein